jgi:uncharacterized cupredoxin-like copper-binding protein
MRSLTRSVLTGAVLCGALSLAAVSTTHVGSAQDSVVLAAEIHAGSCFNLEKDVAYSLGDVERPSGTGVRALPAYAGATVDAGLDALQADTYSIVISRSPNKLKSAVACGEINSVPTADGSVAVGLRELNSSTYAGVALLRPSDAQTAVELFVANGLTGVGAAAGQSEEEEVDEVINVSIDDGKIDANQTDIRAGDVVQFVVHNEGTMRHEVMLEDIGSDEVPLEQDGNLALTTRLAPGEDGEFVYTFEDAGDFQLACHIGTHYEQGEVVELHVE